MTFKKDADGFHFDYVIVGSGFGGSVSALRLAQKGYRVLVVEKGKWLGPEDFPRTNWNLRRWLWMPTLRFFGLFRMTFFRHVGILSGVGVGGGSLVYANTLPVPGDGFFSGGSWAGLAKWKEELTAHYKTALRMLGASPNPRLQTGDLALQRLARERGQESDFGIPDVAVYFGESGVEADDPYFEGQGPRRSGCTFCGGCMLGCRHNAKNTLDKNYLYLAQKHGVRIKAESEVVAVKALDGTDGSAGYEVRWRRSTALFGRKTEAVETRGVIFSGGVLGTVALLLKLRHSTLPHLSPKVGHDVRTNSESLVSVTTTDKANVLSDGVAIGSIFHTDEHSHLEPVRNPEGAGFWRLLMVPMVQGGNFFSRMGRLLLDFVLHPVANFKVIFVDDWAKRTQVLLYMRSLDGVLRLTKGWFGLRTCVDSGKPPTAFMPEAWELAHEYAKQINGKPMVMIAEAALGIPTTAHILGGAVMGDSAETGVIDSSNHVYGYKNMLVCDGSMISANPGVNPSLSITAITERAMSLIPDARSSASG